MKLFLTYGVKAIEIYLMTEWIDNDFIMMTMIAVYCLQD